MGRRVTLTVLVSVPLGPVPDYAMCSLLRAYHLRLLFEIGHSTNLSVKI